MLSTKCLPFFVAGMVINLDKNLNKPKYLVIEYMVSVPIRAVEISVQLTPN